MWLDRTTVNFFPLFRTTVDKFNRKVIPFRAKVLQTLWRHRRGLLSIGAPIFTHDVELTLPFLFPIKQLPIVMVRHEVGSNARFKKAHFYRFAWFREFFRVWEEWTIQRVDRLIVVSMEGLRYYTEKYPEIGQKVVYIPNGVDLSVFRRGSREVARRQFGIGHHQLAVLHVGRLSAPKNQPLLLRTFARIKQQRPDSILLISGTGEDLDKLSSIVREESIADVRFLGELPHDKLPSLYSAADVFLLTSRSEGMPLVILEALACGIPVVSTRVGAIPQVVKDGVCGFVCHEPDVADLAEATLEAARRGNEMQTACLAVAQEHSAEQMAARIFQIFDELHYPVSTRPGSS
jgi:glycosyltransferase involved in cell wall biosynthesis